MSLNPITRVCKHLLLGEGVTIETVELVAPLEGTITEIETLTGTIRCLDD